MHAPDKQQLEGLKAVASLFTLDELIASVNILSKWCMTDAEVKRLISLFTLIKQEVL